LVLFSGPVAHFDQCSPLKLWLFFFFCVRSKVDDFACLWYQTLFKLRLTRNPFSELEEKAFKEIVQQNGFYKVRVPANVIDPGKAYVVAAVKAVSNP
jgi:hypothetical protein